MEEGRKENRKNGGILGKEGTEWERAKDGFEK